MTLPALCLYVAASACLLPPTPPAAADSADTAVAETLSRLGVRAKADYDALRTWRGSYRLRMLGVVSSVQTRTAGGPGPTLDGPLYREREAVCTFEVDFGRGAVSSETRVLGQTYRRTPDGPAVHVDGGEHANARLLQDPGQVVMLRPEERRGAREDDPVAATFRPQDSRTAVRHDPVLGTAEIFAGEAFDPRRLFGPNRVRPAFEDWTHQAGLLLREPGRTTASLRTDRDTDRHTDHTVVVRAFNALEHDLQAQHLMVEWTIREYANGEAHPLASRTTVQPGDHLGWTAEWEWTRATADTPSVPRSFIHTIYRPATGDLVSRKEYTLAESEVNVPAGDESFTLAGMGLREGDRIDDRIDGDLKVMAGKTPIPAAEYVPPPVRVERQAWTWTFVALNVLAAVGFGVWLYRRRAAA